MAVIDEQYEREKQTMLAAGWVVEIDGKYYPTPNGMAAHGATPSEIAAAAERIEVAKAGLEDRVGVAVGSTTVFKVKTSGDCEGCITQCGGRVWGPFASFEEAREAAIDLAHNEMLFVQIVEVEEGEDARLADVIWDSFEEWI
jgi:hypothetical protein